jgi:hypothetical protein
MIFEYSAITDARFLSRQQFPNRHTRWDSAQPLDGPGSALLPGG